VKIHKSCHCDAHYQDKEAQWNHEHWKAEHNTVMSQKQEFELQMASMQLKKLEMEVELVHVKQMGE